MGITELGDQTLAKPRLVLASALVLLAVGGSALADWARAPRADNNVSRLTVSSSADRATAEPHSATPSFVESVLSATKGGEGAAFDAFLQWSDAHSPPSATKSTTVSSADSVNARTALLENAPPANERQRLLDELAVLAALGDPLALSGFLSYGTGSDSHTERSLQLLYDYAARGDVFALMTLANWSRAGIGLPAPDPVSAAAFDYLAWLIEPWQGDQFTAVNQSELPSDVLQRSIGVAQRWLDRRAASP